MQNGQFSLYRNQTL